MRRFSNARRWYSVWLKSSFSALPAHLVVVFVVQYIVPTPWLSCAAPQSGSSALPHHHDHQHQEGQPAQILLSGLPASLCAHDPELAN